MTGETLPKFRMKTYYMVFLKAGQIRSQDDNEASTIQNRHLAYLNHLHETGKIKLSGPFLDDGIIRGIVVYDVESEEEASELAHKDPAVIAGRLEVEIRPWYGPEGLMVKE